MTIPNNLHFNKYNKQLLPLIFLKFAFFFEKLYNLFMKKLKLIYNADSGKGSFKTHLDNVIKIFTKSGFDISILRVEKIKQVEKYLSQIEPDQYHTIVAAGGDGTLNVVVSCVVKYQLSAKIGILPAGTSNDFARSLSISKNFQQAAEIIAKGKTKKVDIGQITSSSKHKQYFINVFGAGAVTNISHHVDPHLKNTIGNMAYYLKALEKLHDNTPLPVTITNSSGTIQAEVYFFLIMNTGAAGGFDNFTPGAVIDDGYFDMMALKSGNIADTLAPMLKFLKGEHLDDERVIYYRDNYTKLEFDIETETNIDGEAGPQPPIEINLLPQAIEIYIP